MPLFAIIKLRIRIEGKGIFALFSSQAINAANASCDSPGAFNRFTHDQPPTQVA
jgi:hypothetical protein